MRSILIICSLAATLAAQTPAPHKIALTRVFAHPGQVGIFVAGFDGSDEHPLLSSKDSDYDPVWSPDGLSIVFTSDRTGSADLFLVKPDGGSGLSQLTNDPAYDDQAAFAPDGKQLVFVSTRGGGTATLWTMDIATRGVKRLTSGKGGDFRPSWSPDGKWIAFSSSRNHDAPFAHGRWERLQLADYVYIIHPDGSGLKKVTNTSGFCGGPKWRSDSRHLVAYCMGAEDTLATRMMDSVSGHVTQSGFDRYQHRSIHGPLRAGPGVEIDPSPLAVEMMGGLCQEGHYWPVGSGQWDLLAA